MNDKFVKQLTEFLDSECGEYGIEYSWEWIEGRDCCEVKLERCGITHYIDFKYNNDDDALSICTHEDMYEVVRWFDRTVRYFWILVAPEIFK